jgi:formate dehydrogenase subunit gamma
MALQALQGEFGHVHEEDVSLVAEAFNVSRADVYGVLTFYGDLRTTPPPQVEVRVCLGEACQAVGSRALLSEAATRRDDSCEVGQVICMGNCALGPTAVVNGRLVGRATAAGIDRAIDEARTGS